MGKAATLRMAPKTETLQFAEISKADVAGFQKILALLTSFDEKTGRHIRFNDQESHFARVALAKVSEENVRFFIKDLGGFIYSVIGYIEGRSCTLATVWVHEDGIRQERDEHSEVKNHPVHSIECLTDLYGRSAAVHADNIPGIVLNLMEDRA